MAVNTVECEDIRYPADAVINLAEAPYHMDPSGRARSAAHNRQALQQALDDHAGNITTRFILYLPNGTYRMDGGVALNTHDEDVQGWNGGSGRGIVLQGQSRDGVVLKLDNAASGFTDARSPMVLSTSIKARLSTAGSLWPSIRIFLTSRLMSVRATLAPLGSIFVQIMLAAFVTFAFAHQTARMWAQPDCYSTIPGPQLLKRVDIDGFDWGMRTASQPNYTTTAEHLTIRNARQGAIHNDRHSLTIRGLTTRDINGPSLLNSHPDGLVTLLEARLDGRGGDAIVNAGALYLRDITASGYTRALTSNDTAVRGRTITEWVSGDGLRTFANAPTSSLQLAIEDTPEPIWTDPSQWVSVTSYGARPGDFSNDSQAIQRALDAMAAGNGPDAGKTVLYFPPVDGETRYDIHATITIPPSVSRIIGCFSNLHPNHSAVTDGPILHVGGRGSPLIIEQFFTGADNKPNPHPVILNTSSRDLILRNIHMLEGQAYVNRGATGALYLEDVSATSLRYWGGEPQPAPSAIPQFDFGNQQVWARQLNSEQKDVNIRNDGGQLWILGIKNEEDGTLIDTRGGGSTELLGGTLMSLDVDTGSDPAFTVVDSQFSAVVTTTYEHDYRLRMHNTNRCKRFSSVKRTTAIPASYAVKTRRSLAEPMATIRATHRPFYCCTARETPSNTN